MSARRDVRPAGRRSAGLGWLAPLGDAPAGRPARADRRRQRAVAVLPDAAATSSNLSRPVMEVAIMALPMTPDHHRRARSTSRSSRWSGLAARSSGFLWAAGRAAGDRHRGRPRRRRRSAACSTACSSRAAGLPSLVVTLGTLALFRGLALVVLGPRGISDFPAWFTDLRLRLRPRDADPVDARRLRQPWRSSSGSSSTARGSGGRSSRSARTRAPPATRASGCARARSALFVLSGLVAALAGRDPDRALLERPRGRRARA